MSSLIEPLNYIRPDHCPNCNCNTIELFDYNNYPMGYSNMVLEYMQSHDFNPRATDKRAVFRMRCKSCGKTFSITWDDNKFPRPMISERDNKLFMALFQEEYKSNIKNKMVI